MPTAKIDLLRQAMKDAGVAAYLIPHADEYQNEYLPPSAERLAFLTGFTGSAGSAIVTLDKAAVFTDGRYTLQAAQEVNTQLYSLHTIPQDTVSDWLQQHCAKDALIGYDPWLHTTAEVKALRAKGLALKALPHNLIDALWHDRPAAPSMPTIPHPLQYAGESSADKRARMAEKIKAAGHQAFLITRPDSLNWLLNMRGRDIQFNPLCLAFGVLNASGTLDLFIDTQKLTPALLADWGDAVTVYPLESLEDYVATQDGIASDHSAAADILGVQTAAMTDPCLIAKACKNKTEVEGARQAHLRDGVAISKCLAWLDKNASSGQIDELQVMQRLRQYREETGALLDLSFETIAGSGAHGAIVHYRATAESNRQLQAGEFFLLDSGGQYQDGTTDITRTLAIGTVTNSMKEHYTRVLKGHIALATAYFPQGTTGHQLDVLARAALWQVGLDYAHGTGHGVGSYLCVHEGPQGISTRANTTALDVGMIVSNEPGYYKTDAYGIRLENLLVVQPAAFTDSAKPFLCFETLTLAPFDTKPLQRELMTAAEIAWLNAYHARVYQSLAPHLQGDDLAWLKQATEAI